ncbi:MAG TPA: glycosyltransferase, partial [Pyrinomonadaceae bacterium]|nr:glycosyltransferase [Pyrinomonadaceae bacterium]
KLFLDAAALCKARRAAAPHAAEDARIGFVVIGDGHLRRELEAQAHALGLGDDVIFTGLRDDPENFYPALDVVALTSRNEGTPLTLIEAMANARPVVATAVGGVVDLLGAPVSAPEANETAATNEAAASAPFVLCARGVRVPPDDAESFAAALMYLLDAADLRRELGARGRAYVVAHYSVERLLTDLLKLYDELRPARTGVPQAVGDLPRGAWSARAKGE